MSINTNNNNNPHFPPGTQLLAFKDIAPHILSYIDTAEDLIALSDTCRIFQHAACQEALWENMANKINFPSVDPKTCGFKVSEQIKIVFKGNVLPAIKLLKKELNEAYQELNEIYGPNRLIEQAKEKQKLLNARITEENDELIKNVLGNLAHWNTASVQKLRETYGHYIFMPSNNNSIEFSFFVEPQLKRPKKSPDSFENEDNDPFNQIEEAKRECFELIVAVAEENDLPQHLILKGKALVEELRINSQHYARLDNRLQNLAGSSYKGTEESISSNSVMGLLLGYINSRCNHRYQSESLVLSLLQDYKNSKKLASTQKT